MKSRIYLKWSVIYGLILMIGICASETSMNIFTKVPALLIIIVAWFMTAKFYFRFLKAEKEQRVEIRERELEEQERRERIKSFYKK